MPTTNNKANKQRVIRTTNNSCTPKIGFSSLNNNFLSGKEVTFNMFFSSKLQKDQGYPNHMYHSWRPVSNFFNDFVLTRFFQFMSLWTFPILTNDSSICTLCSKLQKKVINFFKGKKKIQTYFGVKIKTVLGKLFLQIRKTWFFWLLLKYDSTSNCNIR